MRRHTVSSHFFYNSPRLLCVLRLRSLAMRFAPAPLAMRSAPAFACYDFLRLRSLAMLFCACARLLCVLHQPRLL